MRIAPPAYIRRLAPETALIVKLVDMEMAEARLASAQAPARREGILLRTLLRALPRATASVVTLASTLTLLVRQARPTASVVALASTLTLLVRQAWPTALIVKLVDMEKVEAQTPSAQAPARREGTLLRTLVRALLRRTAEHATLVDMELPEARLASAQATARLAGILLRILLRVLVRVTASVVVLASMAPLLEVTPQVTALIVKLVDMELVEARMPSVQATARLAGICYQQWFINIKSFASIV